MTGLLLRDVELGGHRLDVRCQDGVVVSIGRGIRPGPADLAIEGAGGALVPGLHDHHVHLMATAAQARSVAVGPEQVAGIAELARVLRRAALSGSRGDWVRATGYHDSVAGRLDRWVLDALVGDRPVRVQDRSGAMWILSSAACREVGLDDDPPLGAERGADGRPTGRLVRLDEWLRPRLPASGPPDLRGLARRLNRVGITGVTDATPVRTPSELEALAAAAPSLVVQATGAVALAEERFPHGVRQGPVKVVLADHDLPALDDLAQWFRLAHRARRPVAVHCVTAASLALALATWDAVGSVAGDRIEHGSVVPTGLVGSIVRHRLVVVTQPGFVGERGDDYLAEVDDHEIEDLYRCASLLAAGVRMAASTDSPYTAPDPWAAIATAVDRRTRSGRVLGAGERVGPRHALDLFLSPLDDPGAAARRVEVGVPADLVLLTLPLDSALAQPSADNVAATVVGGRVVWHAGEDA